MQEREMEIYAKGLPEHNWEKYYTLKPGDIYVEIGGFIGRYARIAVSRGCSKIVLIEPSPGNFQALENVLKRKDIFDIDTNKTQVTIVKKAVGKEKGKAKFITFGEVTSHKLKIYHEAYPYQPSDITEVEMDTAENILKELGIDKIDLLAADCEGCENDMVKGLGYYLNNKAIKHLAIATYHGGNNYNIVGDVLRSKGYKDIRHEEGITYASE